MNSSMSNLETSQNSLQSCGCFEAAGRLYTADGKQPVSLFHMKCFPLLSQCSVPQVQRGRCSTTLKFIPNQLPQTNFNCCRACWNRFICPKNRQYRLLLHVLTALHSSHFLTWNRKYTVLIYYFADLSRVSAVSIRASSLSWRHCRLSCFCEIDTLWQWIMWWYDNTGKPRNVIRSLSVYRRWHSNVNNFIICAPIQ